MEENLHNDSSKKGSNNKKIIIIGGIIVGLVIIGIFVFAKVTHDTSSNKNVKTNSGSSGESLVTNDTYSDKNSKSNSDSLGESLVTNETYSDKNSITNSNSSGGSSKPFVDIPIPQPPMSEKPIIYLYPTEETRVSVHLGYANKIIHSYPQYTKGWNVLAKPNGDLIDLDTGRNLYSLYYECESVVNFNVKDDGFIVKGTEVAEFLEEKLKILGLTERESEEFIVYWLPRLEENEYNYIRFATIDEINENMPLEILPNPDSLIRVLMTFKGLEKPINVREQELETPERKGFVAVEWGGAELK